MTEVVCDASVVLKWFQSEGEDEIEAATALLALHRSGKIVAHVLDLTLYEIGNVSIRSLGRTVKQTITLLDAIADICTVIAPVETELHRAAKLAFEKGLSFYDAVYAAVAMERKALLATADQELISAGLGHLPSDIESILES